MSTRGTVDGATYTDVHAQLPAIRLLMVISLFAVVLFLVNIFRRGWVLPVLGVGLWAFVAVVAGDDRARRSCRSSGSSRRSRRKERPYIERNIEATRAAMNLGDVDDAPTSTTTTSSTTARPPVEPRHGPQHPAVGPEHHRRHVPGAAGAQALLQDRRRRRRPVRRSTARTTQVVLSARELEHRAACPQQSWEARTSRSRTATASCCRGSSAQTHRRPARLPASATSRSRTTPDIELDQPGIYFGEDLGGYVDRQHQARGDRLPRTTPARTSRRRTRATTASTIELVAPAGRVRAAVRRLQPAGVGQRHVVSRRSSSTATSTRACSASRRSCTFDADPYPVIVNGRVQWVVDGYTTTTGTRTRSVPITDGPRQLAQRPVQLRAQLGEGRRRRVRRHDDALRRRPQRPDRSRRTRRRSRRCSRPTEPPRRAAGALPLPRGPVPGPDEHVGPRTTSTTPTPSTRTPTRGRRPRPGHADADRRDRAPPTTTIAEHTAAAPSTDRDRAVLPADAAAGGERAELPASCDRSCRRTGQRTSR